MVNINGTKPYQYSSEKFREFNRRAYANTYTLATGDSFDIGYAYSLHGTETKAKIRSYFQGGSWRADRRAIPVFVSKKTLEAITEEDVFLSWDG